MTGTSTLRVLVLDGGSSSGKTTPARELQGALDGARLCRGAATLVDAVPESVLIDDDLEVDTSAAPARSVALLIEERLVGPGGRR